MAFQFGGSQANVTVSGAPATPLPASSQTVINVSGTGSGSNQNAYTVTSGKTFYLMGFWTEEDNGAFRIFANDGTTVRVRTRPSTTAVCGGFFPSTNPIAVYTTAQNVVANFTNLKLYGFWGIEQ